MKKLSVIIVSWEVRELLSQCLNSIVSDKPDGLETEIFVVDNNSKDGTAKMVENDFPQVKLIANSKNLGFARANNQALALANGEFVLLLNPDTIINSAALTKSINFLESNHKAGIVGVKFFNPDGSLQPSVRRYPNIRAILAIFFKLAKIFPNLPALKKYLAADFDYSREQKTDQVMGAFMMIKREVFEKIGFLDEKFFLWFEEVDFCRRAQNAGFECWYLPDISIVHYGGQSFAQKMTIKKQFYFFLSAWRYFRKHGFKN